MSEQDESHGFLFGFFLGGLLGAALIFLLGTKEGKKIAEKLKEKGGELAEELEGKIEETGEKVEAVKKDLTSQAVEKLDTALVRLEEAQGKAQEATENIRQRFFTRSGKKLS